MDVLIITQMISNNNTSEKKFAMIVSKQINLYSLECVINYIDPCQAIIVFSFDIYRQIIGINYCDSLGQQICITTMHKEILKKMLTHEIIGIHKRHPFSPGMFQPHISRRTDSPILLVKSLDAIVFSCILITDGTRSIMTSIVNE